MGTKDVPLTIPEAAQLCGCSPDTIRRRIRSGQLAAKRTEEGWQLRRADLVKAGLCDPGAAGSTEAAVPNPTAAPVELEAAHRQVQRLQDRLEAVQALVDERADRIRFLKRLFDRCWEGK